MTGKIIALLVGINKYSPMSYVSSLSGCQDDVNRMEKFLLSSFANPAPQIRKLINEQATRANFISVFTEHLCNNANISEGDTILYYHSGHGSYARSAPEFAALGEDAENNDETLVLYDSRIEGNYDLADKELAWLLSKIPSKTNVVVILDSCHSGSATRSAEDRIRLEKPKFTPARFNDAGRPISEYHGYADMVPIAIPESKYILLAACGRQELAYEIGGSGLFTGKLLELLRDTGNIISYADLFERLHNYIRNFANRQTPQMSLFNNFNPRLIFLGDESLEGNPLFEAVFSKETGGWLINAGALHGLKNDPLFKKNASIALYKKNQLQAPAATCKIKSVGLSKSIIDYNGPINEQFAAEILNRPPDITVLVKAETNANDWLSKFTAKKLPGIAFYSDSQAALFNYILEINNDSIAIKDFTSLDLLHGVNLKDEKKIYQELLTGRDRRSEDEPLYQQLKISLQSKSEEDVFTGLLNAAEGTNEHENFLKLTNEKENRNESAFKYITRCMAQIGRWTNTRKLENHDTSLNQDEVDFYLERYDNNSNSWIVCNGNHLTFDFNDAIQTVKYRIKLSSRSAVKYYISVYHISSTFRVRDLIKDADSRYLTETFTPLKVGKNRIFQAPPEENPEDVDVFKLVVSQEPFNDYFLTGDEDLERKIGDMVAKRASVDEKDEPFLNWFTKTIEVRTIRQNGKIDKLKGFKSPVIEISKHPSFEASVSLTPLSPNTRSASPANYLQQLFNQEGYEIISLAEPFRSGDTITDQRVVELYGIENERTLNDDPLEMVVNYKLNQDEELLAITYDGEFILPLGLVQKNNDGHHQFLLTEPPVVLDPQRDATKNPLRALWFCFLKVVLKKEEEVYKLRQIVYKDGKADYKKEDPEGEILRANKILLIVHGIIGNGKGIAQNLEYLLLEEKYNLILSFDYENLNTDLQEIAQKLRDMLVEKGVSEHKKIDILAHSMGGLVSRYMIEILREDKMVDRLFMFGTPNNGSAFGKIPAIRDWATNIIAVVCNFGKEFLGDYAAFINGVNAVIKSTAVVTNTLSQMNEGSPFLIALNNDKPAVTTRYYIVAGNTQKYIDDSDAVFKRFLEKMKVNIGKLAYGHTTNDIAVSVKSITTIPPAWLARPSEEVGCHHMNYFEHPASLDKLKEIVT